MTANLEQHAREAFEALDATLKLEAIGRGKSVARTATRRFAEMLLPLLNPITIALKGQPASSGWEGIASEAEAEAAIKHLELAIEAARNSNQAGENAVVRAASAIGWRGQI